MFVIIVIGYLFLSLLATVVVISACIMSGRADQAIEEAMGARQSPTVEPGPLQPSHEPMPLSRGHFPKVFSPVAK